MTETRRTPPSRYREGCIAAHALDVLGDRWALLVIRELLLGAKRFQAVRAGLPGISANVLTQRLEGLEAQGLLGRRMLPPPAQVQVYELTVPGLAVRPVIEALCRWGAGFPGHDPGRFISPTALMLSMAAMIDPEAGRAADGLSAGFRLGEEAFAARVAAGRLEVVRDPDAGGEIRFDGTANAVAAAVYAPRPLAQTLAEGRVGFDGDPARGQAFVDLFSLRRLTPPRRAL